MLIQLIGLTRERRVRKVTTALWTSRTGLSAEAGYAHARFLRQVCTYTLTRATACMPLSIEVFGYFKIASTDFLFLQSRHAYR